MSTDKNSSILKMEIMNTAEDLIEGFGDGRFSIESAGEHFINESVLVGILGGWSMAVKVLGRDVPTIALIEQLTATITASEVYTKREPTIFSVDKI